MCDSQSPRPTPVVLTISLREIGVLGQPACSQTPQRSPPPARPASWATLAAHVSHFPGTPLALPPRARPPSPCPHHGSAQPASPASPFSVPVPGEQSSRFLRPLFLIACSRMPDAGLARTRTALLLPRWGFHVTCWEASLSSPFRHSADLLFSILRHSPSEGSFPLPGRPSLAASRAFWAPRLPRPSEGGHRGDFKAPSSPCFSPLPPRTFYPFHLCFSFRRFFLLTIGH